MHTNYSHSKKTSRITLTSAAFSKTDQRSLDSAQSGQRIGFTTETYSLHGRSINAIQYLIRYLIPYNLYMILLCVSVLQHLQLLQIVLERTWQECSYKNEYKNRVYTFDRQCSPRLNSVAILEENGKLNKEGSRHTKLIAQPIIRLIRALPLLSVCLHSFCSNDGMNEMEL